MKANTEDKEKKTQTIKRKCEKKSLHICIFMSSIVKIKKNRRKNNYRVYH